MNFKRDLDSLKRKVRSHFFNPDPFPVDAWTDPGYEAWFEHHKASESELSQQRSETFEVNPTFSIIVPLYNTPFDYLTVMVESVLRQTYTDFELILVNGSPEIAYINELLDMFCDEDPRITQVKLERNLGITENTNEGIDIARGDFLCFLDHDDSLEPDLLFEYASAINKDQEIDVLYCDEDLMIVKDGKRSLVNPLLKPDYSPELLLCKNYIVHLMCIRRSLVAELDRPTSVYDGAQDYNMVLQAAQKARRICHIPKVLYHWRISDNSTAANPEAKPYSRQAYRKAAFNQISERWDHASIISSGIVNIHNVWFSPVATDQKISVIVSCRSSKGAANFIQLFKETNSWNNYEVLFVGCDDESLNSDDGIRFIESSNTQNVFTQFNLAAKYARGDYLVFMGEGSFFLTPEPLEQLYALVTSEGVGIAAPKILYANGSNKSFGIAVTPKRIMPLYRGYPDDFPGYQCNLRAFQNTSAVANDGLMIAKQLFEEVGGFDDRFESEVGTAEFCKRVRDREYRIVVTPTVKIQTSDQRPTKGYDNHQNSPDFLESDVELFDEKWPGSREKGDPYFNRNLDQGSCYFQLPAK